MAQINPVSSKIAIKLNTTPEGGSPSTKNVTISKLALDITAAKISAVVAALTPLFDYSVVSVSKTDVGALVD